MSEIDDLVTEARLRVKKRHGQDWWQALSPHLAWAATCAELAQMLAAERRKARKA